MSGLNYHEMTMNEPRNSPARRQQFLIITTVMMSCFCYGFITAGGLHRVTVIESTLTGGTFIYKSTKRDYAASLSLAEQIGIDSNLNPYFNEFIDQIYMFYLDHPFIVTSGRKQRFACGYLARDNKNKNTEENEQQLLDSESIKDKLLNINDSIKPLTRKEVDELPAFQLWKRLKYKQQQLPKETKVLVSNFPFSNGFVSSLMFSYKILPSLHQQTKLYYKEKFGTIDVQNLPPIIVISTCSQKDSICTHYVPVSDDLNNIDNSVKPFLLGQPSMKEYAPTLPKEPLVDVNLMINDMKKIASKITNLFSFSKSSTTTTESSSTDEL